MPTARFRSRRATARFAVTTACLLILVGCAVQTRPTVTRTPPPPLLPPEPVTADPRPPARTPLPPPPRPLPPPPAPTPAPVASTSRTTTLGWSEEGRPIVLHEFGHQGPCLFIFGGIHGSEPTSVDIAEGALRLLAENPDLYERNRIAILPRANPDGLERGRRANARGVDLNRNFPARNWRRRAGHGVSPGSESETRVLLAAMEHLQPTAVVSVHSIRSQAPCNNYDGPGQHLAELLARHNGYAVKASIGYPTPGSFGSWSGHDLGIPTITLELPRSQPGPDAWLDNRDAVLALLRDFGSHLVPSRAAAAQ